jgi:hypothetical protein
MKYRMATALVCRLMLNIRDPRMRGSTTARTTTATYLTSVMDGPEEDAGQATRAEKDGVEGIDLPEVLPETAPEEIADIEMNVRRQL